NYPLRTEAGKGGCALYFSLNERAVCQEFVSHGFLLKYALIYFYFVSSDFLIIFVRKFIMLYYGAERYNEAAAENIIPDTAGSR
ncbi:MAG: hypothetical protein K2G24_03810, partial [Muribaculaceae bacterium]|nr:hypothetical protein [Muribaculaceae bacterium]